MARKYGLLYSSVWNDPDFRSLTSDAQRLYMMLISQADISSCGMLPITFRRWSNNAIDTPIDRLSNAFRLLCDRRYLVADLDREEVIVRSFIRWDEGYKVPKRLKAIIASIGALSSVVLQQVAIGELDKLGVAHDIHIDTPIDTGTGTPIDIAQVPGYTYVSTLGTGNQEPETGNHEPSTPSADDYPDDFLEFWAAYPRRDGKRKAHAKYRAALKRADHQAILAGAERYRDDPNRKTEFTAMATTWLERDGWDDGPIPGPSNVTTGPWTPPPGSPLSYVEM